ADAGAIEGRAKEIAIEQSVEMPAEAIDDRAVLSEIVGRVESIADRGDGSFTVRIGLAAATTGPEPGQLLNMLFGNSSIHDDVTLEDAEFPPAILAAFGGPRHGITGLRARCGARGRAMTCSALKPQGIAPEALGALASRMAEGGLDYIKDDHGLADQAYSPFAERVRAVMREVAAANRRTGGRTRYAPSLSGHLDQMRAQIRAAREEGVDTLLIAPMVAGVATFHALVRECPDMAFMAHPAMSGASRIAPPLLIGKLFRLLGADAAIFPNHGGRFGYTPATCLELAWAARGVMGALKPCAPVPAGGMTLARVGEMLDFYGRDVMLLIGGGLLAARENLTREAAAFQRRVAAFTYGK
ncbi:MAG: RuBisCO large subunit C-terminal-like domain-containing protein, partial [Rhodospirillales bacterium]